MITRMRVEASAKTSEQVTDELVAAIATFREQTGGEWEDAEGQGLVPELQTTQDGWWGRLTIKRKENS